MPVVAQNLDIGKAAAKLWASLVTVAAEKLHRWVTGEHSSGASFGEERLGALGNKPANQKQAEETQPIANAACIETRQPVDAPVRGGEARLDYLAGECPGTSQIRPRRDDVRGR